MIENRKSDFNEFIESIQKELDEDAEKTYSKKVIAECENPQNIGRMPDPDAVGIITGSCGDTMEIFLKINRKRIVDIQYMTGKREEMGSEVEVKRLTQFLVFPYSKSYKMSNILE